MNHFHPSAAADEGMLTVRLFASAPIRSVEIDCVLDLTDFGEVVGIEVLDLRRQLAGGVVELPEPDGDVRWSYDGEIDAFYLHVADGRGQVQRSARARAQLDSMGRLVRMDVELPESI